MKLIESFITKLKDIFQINEENKKNKLIKKNIQTNRFQFYIMRSNEASSEMGKFFFRIYRLSIPLKKRLTNAKESQNLIHYTIEYYLTKEEKEIALYFNSHNINDKLLKQDISSVSATLHTKLSQYTKSFTDNPNKIQYINHTYAMIHYFLNFINFDFEQLLYFFTTTEQHPSVSTVPKFRTVSIEKIIEKLVDFLYIAYPLRQPFEWEAIFTILKQYKNIQFSFKEWMQTIHNLRKVLDSQIFEYIIQYITNEHTHISYQQLNFSLIRNHLELYKDEVKNIITTILLYQQNETIESLLKKVLHNPEIEKPQLPNYNESLNLIIQNEQLPVFASPLLIATVYYFLKQYFVKEVKTTLENILIHGDWAYKKERKLLHTTHYKILDIIPEIQQFDLSFSLRDNNINTLKKHIENLKANKFSNKKQIIDFILFSNKKYDNIVHKAIHLLNVCAHQIRLIINDYDTEKPELILNWKKMNILQDNSLKDNLISIYKRIFFLSQFANSCMEYDNSMNKNNNYEKTL